MPTSSGTTVDYASDRLNGISPVFSNPDGIHTSWNSLPLADALLTLRFPFTLNAFNVRTVMRVNQQGCLARALKTPAIDTRNLQEACKQDYKLSYAASIPI